MNAFQLSVLLLLAGVVGYVVYLLRKAIISKIGQEKYDLINKVVEDIVRYCEQMGLNVGWNGEDKKRMAVNLIHAALEKLGYQVDEKLIDILIERAVQVLNENVLTGSLVGLSEYTDQKGSPVEGPYAGAPGQS